MNGKAKEAKSPVQEESRKKPGEIEEDIRETRAQMDETLNVLERKLSPRELLDEIFSFLGSSPRDYALNLGRAIRDNPLPAALAGIGLVWLMIASTKSKLMDYYEAGRQAGWQEAADERAPSPTSTTMAGEAI